MTRAERDDPGEVSPRDHRNTLQPPQAEPAGAMVTAGADGLRICWRCGVPYSWTDEAVLARCTELARDALEERTADGLCPSCAAGLEASR